MKRVIKSQDAAPALFVRPIATNVAAIAAAPVVDSALDQAQARIAELEAALADQIRCNDLMPAELEKAFARGRAEGAAAGRAEALNRESERLALLEVAIAAARSDLAGALEGAERLALLLARDSLDILLGDPDYRSEILIGLIRQQVAQAGQAAIVEVRVCPEDFPDMTALEKLNILNGNNAALRSDASMTSGQCRMILVLGQADIGLDQQWATMRSLLGDMAAEPGA